MPDRSRCPKCREPVSPFAAGCAICGTDLDTKRWDTGPSGLTRLGSWLSALSFGPAKGGHWFLIAFLLLFFVLPMLSGLIYMLL